MADELKQEPEQVVAPKRPRRPRTPKKAELAEMSGEAAALTVSEESKPAKKRTRRASAPTETSDAPKPRTRRKKSDKPADIAQNVPAPAVETAEKPESSPEIASVVEPVQPLSEGVSRDSSSDATTPADDISPTPPQSVPQIEAAVEVKALPPAAETTEVDKSRLEVVPITARSASAPRLRPAELPSSSANAPQALYNGRPRENRKPDGARTAAPGRRDLPKQREAPLTMAQLDAMTLLELYKLARQLNIDNFRQYKKGELIWEILRARTHKDGFVFVQGLLDIVGDYGFLRPTDFQRSREDVYVSASQIRRFDLRAGDQVSGQARPPKDGERYFALLRVEAVNALSPEKSAERPDFDGLTPIFPDSRFRLETSREDLACRLVDIIAPIGRGQRGLVVAPPKAGKTVLLKKLANAISQNSPETHLMVLLIDERPEEVTDMERSVKGEVASSTFDEPPEDHIRVAEMVLERAKRLVEMGRDVVILLDSITRLARAYNLTVPASGRTLSGGMDPAALHKPKRFFGAARKVEHGGSLTILATALVDTGSRMDDVIYEEFKGTGNMELHLDRKLAERRTFPAVDIKRSGTRREDLLMTPEELDIIWQVRKAIHNLGNQEATELLLQNLKRTRSNAEFFKLFMASQGSQG
ncbi:MAG: transcription termination factor Rho [Sulfobacillus acidophilus]|uniref:Transcription termination factor Rho n=1 Tax=Sulfobacillus acidophilus TaxID=53633 RepID=A0A2T2WED6_9FIRM|nr:MAG: transcription termination factor Rho [Sulfobacillus acidophilus]